MHTLTCDSPTEVSASAELMCQPPAAPARRWSSEPAPRLRSNAPWDEQKPVFMLLAEAVAAADMAQDGLRTPAERRAAARWWRAARDELVLVNVGLVHAVLNMPRFAPVTDEKWSEAFRCLGRAVERFDLTRGNRFSTYATRSIIKGICRAYRREQSQTDHFLTLSQCDGYDGGEPAEPADDAVDIRTWRAATDQIEAVRKLLRETNMTAAERVVISLRFGLGGGDEGTLETAGAAIGVSKERARQMQNVVLARLRRRWAAANG